MTIKARLVDHIRGEDQRPGDIEFRAYPDGTPAGYAYRCPGCGQDDWLPIREADSSGWTWDRNREAPTLKPSILHRSCRWHGYLTAGEFVPC